MTDSNAQLGAVAVGLALERRIQVGEDRVITFMGKDLQVYETPSMIADVEYACRDLLFENLPAGLDSVGTLVDIKHLAPTPQDQTVTVQVSIQQVDNRRVRFFCEVYDAKELVGQGIHDRFVINIERHRQRVLQKRSEMQQA